MKLTSSLVVGALLLAGTAAFAQTANANATISANILTSISLVEATNMSFGDFVQTGSGTVILIPAGTTSVTGGVVKAGGTVTNASFTVGGTPSHTYAITLPSSDVLITPDGGTHTMAVNAFSSTSTPSGALNGSGSGTIAVGATLNVGASQFVGNYTGTFNVIVAYN